MIRIKNAAAPIPTEGTPPLKAITVVTILLFVAAVVVSLDVSHVAANGTERVEAAAQTKQVAKAATAFLNTLTTEQRRKIAFPFIPLKTAVKASFHRTADGGVALGAPATSSAGKGPGGPPQTEERHMGPPGGFVGEQYGSAVWSNYPVSDVLRPGVAREMRIS